MNGATLLAHLVAQLVARNGVPAVEVSRDLNPVSIITRDGWDG